MSQIPRDITSGEEGRKLLASGIKKLAGAVKSTLGARGQTVLIESPASLRGITITKDGITVAKDIQLENPIENLAVNIIRDAADRTASSAGDGTTTSIVLAEALVNAGMEMIKPSDDKTEILREINLLTLDITKNLKKSRKKLTKGRMKDVASISANNDAFIGNLVAEAYSKSGKNALVSVEKSDTAKTYIDVTKGIKMKRGYDTVAYVNNQERDQCILEDAIVLITDHQLSKFSQIESILQFVSGSGRALFIIGNVTNEFKNMLAANVMKNGLKVCSIVPPQFGYKQHEMLGDLAVALGGKYFSEKTGDDLSQVTIEDCGTAKKIIVDRHSTTISNSNENVSERINELIVQKGLSSNKKADIEHLNERIAILDGGMGVIYAGGNSDVEQKELFDRIEDAVCAVKAGIEDGVIAGGGIPLLREALLLEGNPSIAARILSFALSAPFTQIMKNSGKDDEWIGTSMQIIWDETNKNYGYDVKADRYEDLSKVGVLDPLKVTLNALTNAVSVATTILGTDSIITLARAEK